jgi:hypothetical protein
MRGRDGKTDAGKILDICAPTLLKPTNHPGARSRSSDPLPPRAWTTFGHPIVAGRARHRGTMQARTRRGHVGALAVEGASSSSSTSFLTMYAEQPDFEVTLEDFEVSAFDRLRGAWTGPRGRRRRERAERLARVFARAHPFVCSSPFAPPPPVAQCSAASSRRGPGAPSWTSSRRRRTGWRACTSARTSRCVPRQTEVLRAPNARVVCVRRAPAWGVLPGAGPSTP